MPQTENYRMITPYLVVSDAEKEMTFLKEAFGATELECHRAEDQRVMHAELQVGDSLLMLGECATQDVKKAAFYLWVPDVDASYARAVKAGGAGKSAPADMPYGHRSGEVADPAGNTWWIASPVKK